MTFFEIHRGIEYLLGARLSVLDFLEDNRVYTTKMYGMGRPKDNNAFQYLDISKLKALPMKVEITNTEDNPVNTKAKA